MVWGFFPLKCESSNKIWLTSSKSILKSQHLSEIHYAKMFSFISLKSARMSMYFGKLISLQLYFTLTYCHVWIICCQHTWRKRSCLLPVSLHIFPFPQLFNQRQRLTDDLVYYANVKQQLQLAGTGKIISNSVLANNLSQLKCLWEGRNLKNMHANLFCFAG